MECARAFCAPVSLSSEHLLLGNKVDSCHPHAFWKQKQIAWSSFQVLRGRVHAKRLRKDACPCGPRIQWHHQHPALTTVYKHILARSVGFSSKSSLEAPTSFKVEASTQVEEREKYESNRNKVGSRASSGPLPSERAAPAFRIIGIGIGTAGGKMLNHMDAFLPQSNADLWAMNTDAQALKSSGVPHQLQLGAERMQGLGTGGDSRAGAEAAAASLASIEEVLRGRPGVCYVVCGAGGGTGGGASPLVLRAARNAGHLSVAIVTMPFGFEGPRRMRQARATVGALHEAADVIIAIDQDAFLQHHHNLSMTQAAGLAANMALDVIAGITHLLQVEPAPRKGSNPETSEVLGTMKLLRTSGRAVVGCGQGRTVQRAVEAALRAPGLGSLHMFAANVMCVLSSSRLLGPMDVGAACTSIAAVTSRHRQPVIATRQDRSAEGGVAVTIFLTGLPQEFSDVPASPGSTEQPSLKGPVSKAQAPPIEKDTQRSSRSDILLMGKKALPEQPERSRNLATEVSGPSTSAREAGEVRSAVAPEARGGRPQAATGAERSSEAPIPRASSASQGQTGSAKDKQQAGPVDYGSTPGTNSPRLQGIPTGGPNEQGASGSGAKVGRKEPSAHSAAALRGPGSPSLEGRMNHEAEPQKRGQGRRDAARQGPHGHGAVPESASSWLEQKKLSARDGLTKAQAPAAGQRQTENGATQGSTSSWLESRKSNTREGTARPLEPTDASVATDGIGAGRASEDSNTGGREGAVGQEGAAQQPGFQGEQASMKQVPSAGAHRVASSEGELRPRQQKQLMEQGALQRGSAQGEEVSAKYRRAAAANAAALQWWQEVVEAQAEKWGEDKEDEEVGEEEARAGPGDAVLSVSARARSILERERSQEQYRVVAVKQVLPDGSLYEGHLGMQGPHGQGTCVYPWGDVYEGAWWQGERHGWGKLAERSGDVYEGSWRRGHRHGKGRLAYANGHVLTAHFVDGHVHGPAIIAFAHGTTFYGAFKFNRRQGVAITVDADGQRTWEVWDHGQRIS